MERRNFLRNLGLLSAVSGMPALPLLAKDREPSALASVSVKGKVHHNGKGIPGVAMSDGYHVTVTDRNGNYQLQTHHDAAFVFISLPSGYVIPHEKGITRCYTVINRKATQQTYDVALQPLPQGDEKHAFVVWADPQIWDQADADQLTSVSAPDTRDAVARLGNIPVHGIGCGDLVFDKFDLFKDYNKAVEITGIPFFQVLGNHDMDYKTARTDDQSQETFHSLYGPAWYSFNRGRVHYVVLDDVFFIGMAKRYIGYISEAQLQWLEKDLAQVPHGSTVVVSLHIPTNTGNKKRKKLKEEELGGVVSNRAHLYELLQPYKVHIMSGHTHWNENWEKDNIMEHNHGTLCGAWWCGPVCGDGTPAGYCIYEVNGSDISWYYKSTGKPEAYQLKIHARGSITEKPQAVPVNVWNHDNRWKVEWWEDGVAKGAMTPYMGYDPEAYTLYIGDQLPQKHKWVEPILTSHLFLAEPAAGAKEIKVQATDRFGKTYSAVMSL